MPAPTLEQLKQREVTLRGKLAGEGLAPERRRGLHKRLRRAQRRRRLLVKHMARTAPKKTEAAAS